MAPTLARLRNRSCLFFLIALVIIVAAGPGSTRLAAQDAVDRDPESEDRALESSDRELRATDRDPASTDREPIPTDREPMPVLPGPQSPLAYTPDAIWGAGAGATAGLSEIQDGAIHLFDGMTPAGRVLGDLRLYRASDAKIARSGDLVAFIGRLAGTGARRAARARGMDRGVAVYDTSGRALATFPEANSFSWSPDGAQLAVVYPRMKSIGGARAKGVALWNRRTRATRSFALFPSRAGWAGRDSLLLQFSDRVDRLDPVRGKAAPTGHYGTVIAPDGLYSMRPGELGRDTRITEDETGADVTERIFGSMLERNLGQIRAAFWVRVRGADHLMCVSGCDDIYGSDPRCTTEIIDVGTLETIASFPGEAIGPSADEQSVTVLRRDLGRLVAVDLRPLVRRWVGEGTFH
jgi:hypothetical protein